MTATNFSAKVIADSIATSGRIITLQLHYPRFIHAEFMTHRMFSRNASSSRAIPTASVLDTVVANPALPVHWGKNQKGMQAEVELSAEDQERAKAEWLAAIDSAVNHSRNLGFIGCHKQIANRVTEFGQHINVVVTATEWANFFKLRNHQDAQPEIQLLAQLMLEAIENSDPMQIKEGEWHVPYVSRERREDGTIRYFTELDEDLEVNHALRISASACAQVSYRKNDLSLDKAKDIWDRLIFSEPRHASPIEHQATPAPNAFSVFSWPQGVTHIDRDSVLWSGNFRGWIQARQLID